MEAIYERITRWFLNLYDPYDLTGHAPERKLLPYLKAHITPMRRVIIASVLVTVFAAGILSLIHI